MGHNPFETGREAIDIPRIDVGETHLYRYDPLETNSTSTSIYLAADCPHNVGDLLWTYSTDSETWQQFNPLNTLPMHLSPYSPMWMSPFLDGRFSTRVDFLMRNEVERPFAIFMHIFSNEPQAMGFLNRLPRIYDALVKEIYLPSYPEKKL